MDKKIKKTVLAVSAFIVMLAFGRLSTAALLSDTTETLRNVFTKGLKYTLIYHANTGSAADDAKVTDLPDAQTEYGDGASDVTFTVSTKKPVRAGFVFAGWFAKEEPTGDDIKYGDGGASTYTAGKDQRESHLYAKWEAGFTLIYDANGGNGVPAITTSGSETVSGSTVTVVSNASSYTFENIATQGAMTGPPEADGTADHRVFLGWSTSNIATEPEITADGKLAYGNEAEDYDKLKVDGFAKQVEIDGETNKSKTVVLYAVWATKYILDFQKHPEMITPEVTGVPTPMQTYVTVDKTHVFHIPVETDANRPTRAGGYLWGWWGDNLERFKFTKPNEGQSSAQAGNEGCYQFNEDITELSKDAPVQILYAYFQPPSACAIIFKDNTDNAQQFPDSTDRDSKQVSEMPKDNPRGASTTLIEWKPVLDGATPKHTRYKFVEWNTKPDGTGKSYDVDDEVVVNKILQNEITLYAIWKPMHIYRLQTNLNGGSNLIYIRKSDRTWQSGSSIWFESDTTEYETAASKWISDTSYTWPADYFSNKGVFAVRKDDSKGEYKFLGWSWEKVTTSTDEAVLLQKVDFPVEIPEDHNTLIGTVYDPQSKIGVIAQDVTVQEGTPCTKPERHTSTLYAVWRRSPKHQLKVIFSNSGASGWQDDAKTTEHFLPEKGKDDYYASLDYPGYTWDATYWAANAPVPYKNATETASYEFIGWNTMSNGTGESYSIDPTTKRLNVPVTVSESAASAAECAGGIHSVTLYPVFETTPKHTYKLNYNANIPGPGTNTKKMYLFKDGAWTEASATGTYSSYTTGLDEKSYEWQMSDVGMFATSTSTGTAPTSDYTFIGWSYEQFNLTNKKYDPTNPDHVAKLVFPVTQPANPADPQGNEGRITSGSVVIDDDEQDPRPSTACTDTQGKTHTRTLYGVWLGTPKHQYSLIFVGNARGGDGKDAKSARILYGSAEAHAAGTATEKNESITKGTKDWDDPTGGAVNEALSNSWRLYSDPFEMPADGPGKSDSFDLKDLLGAETIVKARREATTTTRWEFAGWNTKPDGSGTTISVDSSGAITDSLTVTDSDYPCGEGEIHNEFLYAQWRPVPIHNYQLIFYPANGSALGIQDGSTWRGANYVTGYKSSIRKDTITDIDLPDSLPNTLSYISQNVSEKADVSVSPSKTWESGTLRVAASKASDEQYEYEFLGWSEEIVQPATGNTVADVDYTVNEQSYVQGDITISEPDTTCGHGTHTKMLYPVFKAVPVHNFKLTLDLNDGNGLRYVSNVANNTWGNTSTREFYYPSSKRVRIDDPSAGSSYTWTADEFFGTQGHGYGAYRNYDSDYSYELVGWSTEKVEAAESPDMSHAVSWEYVSTDYAPSDTDHLYPSVNGYIRQDITASCDHSPCQGGTHNTTLYAIWKAIPRTKTYNLVFDVNAEGGTGAPDSMQKKETYNGTKWVNEMPFDMPAYSQLENMKNKKKVFVGWNTNKDATQGKYGTKNTSNTELEELTRLLESPYKVSIESNKYEKTDTLYAVWWYEFELVYDANGGANAPEHEHSYTSDKFFDFPISTSVPTNTKGWQFLGWSEDPNATTPTFVASTSENEVQFRVNAVEGGEDEGYTKKTLYAVWNKNPLNTGGFAPDANGGTASRPALGNRSSAPIPAVVSPTPAPADATPVPAPADATPAPLDPDSPQAAPVEGLTGKTDGLSGDKKSETEQLPESPPEDHSDDMTAGTPGGETETATDAGAEE